MQLEVFWEAPDYLLNQLKLKKLILFHPRSTKDPNAWFQIQIKLRHF